MDKVMDRSSTVNHDHVNFNPILIRIILSGDNLT